MNYPQFVIEKVDDPSEIARHQAQRERGKGNSDWLQTHWPDLLPDGRGKFVAVAGREAFVADEYEEACGRAEKPHQEDDATLRQFVLPHKGPRFYGHLRRTVDL
jgi:hypothetical protein